MIEEMVLNVQHGIRGRAGFEHYVNSRQVVVSEHSCEWDPPGTEHSNVASCKKQSGQYDADYGTGSLAVLDSGGPGGDIVGWSWWTTWRSGEEINNLHGGLNSRLCFSDGSLAPMGQAWLYGQHADCESLLPPPRPPPPPSLPPSPSPAAPPAYPEACPYLAEMEKEKRDVYYFKPNSTTGWCGSLGSKMNCNQAYRWRPKKNSDPNVCCKLEHHTLSIP